MKRGVWVTRPDGTPELVAAPPLTDEEVQGLVGTIAQRVVRLLQRRGLLEPDGEDPLWEEEPLLASVTAASVQGRVATGDRRGERVRRRLIDPEGGIQSGPLCFAARGFSLHGATRLAAGDRCGLGRLARYVMRPPLAAGRLRFLDAGHLTFART